jgi:UDP-N-acetylmuramoylalanine--D-glutamate ligase
MKKIAIFGIGISGLSTIDFLIKNNRQIIAIDDNLKSLEALKEKYKDQTSISGNIETCPDKNQIDWGDVDFLVLSPGVPLKYPRAHDIVNLAKKHNCKIIGDTELFYMLNKNKNFIGITGTNGKSTTTSLVGHIFKENKVSSQIGGNIGIPCFDLKQSDNYIFEMSSYQLDLSLNTHFHISAILNITPDHLDRHKDMKGYIEAKKRIFLNQTKDDVAVLNVDDENCYKIYCDLSKDKSFKGKVIAISTKESIENSICVINNQIINNINNTVIDIGKLKNLTGNHNNQNIALSYAISSFCGISDAGIINSIKTFKGLEHRLEFVKKVNNISFINDSKATNVEAALCALESYKNILWIAGGESKNDDFSILKPYLKNITKAFLIGKDQEKIANFLNRNKVDNSICDTLEKAFIEATKFIKKDSKDFNVLLSPACASFDQWKNFEARGSYFCQLVNNFSHEK